MEKTILVRTKSKSARGNNNNEDKGSWRMLKTRSISLKNITTNAKKAIALRRAESRHLKRTKTAAALKMVQKEEVQCPNQFTRLDYLRGSQIRTPSKNGNKACDLEKKIDVEIRMKQAAQNMMEHIPMDHSQQSAEAAKNLIVSEEKMEAFRKELDTRSVLTATSGRSNEREPSRAKLAVSEMRFPLMWRERDHFKNRGDSRQFAMFAVFRVGSDICDTALIYGIDRTCTDVAFSDIMIFENVLPGFQVFVTLYSAQLDPNRLMSGSASLRLKHRLKGSFTRSLGHKWGSLARKNADQGTVGDNETSVKFHPVASAVLSIREAGETAKTHDFQLHPIEEHCCPPLYGHFCCRLMVQPFSAAESLEEGILSVQIKDRPFPNLWCRLREGKLSCWRSKNEMHQLPPIIELGITQDCIMQTGRRNDCLIVSVPIINGAYAQYVLVPHNNEALAQWKISLQTQIYDCKFWGGFATKCMRLGHESQETEKPYFMRTNCRNLYDEISIAGEDLNTDRPLLFSRKRPSVRNFFTYSSSASSSGSTKSKSVADSYKHKGANGAMENIESCRAPSEKVLMRKKQTNGTSRKERTRKSLSNLFSRGNKESRL